MINKRCISYFILVFIMIFILSATTYSAVFNVTNPVEFQDALNTAAGNGEDDTINAASGTYYITTTLTYSPETTENFALTITGAGAGSTVLDGGGFVQILNIATGGLVSDDHAHISISDIALSGGMFDSSPITYGGGAFITSASGDVTLTNNTFSGNTAYSDYHDTYDHILTRGGGAFITSTSGTITLINNTFSNNTAYASFGSWHFSYGGGAYVYSDSGTITLINNTFSNNTAPFGCDSYGGGAFVASTSGDVTLTNNTFSGNLANETGWGGGAYVASTSGDVTLINNTFRNNAVSDFILNNDRGSWGGGAYVSGLVVTLTNNTFSGNLAADVWYSQGGGAFVAYAAKADIYNNIIYGNTANEGGNDGDDLYVTGMAPVNLFNNNLGLNADFITAMSEDLVVTNIDNYSQGFNIQADCLLTADLHLRASSPCIDAGDNNAPSLPPTDFEGDPRIIDGNGDMVAITDIGADEYLFLCPDLPVRIARVTPVYFSTLQEAYNSAFGGETIQSQAVVFTEDLNISLTKSVTLEGGYDCDYNEPPIGKTILNGNMNISKGTVTIENFSVE